MQRNSRSRFHSTPVSTPAQVHRRIRGVLTGLLLAVVGALTSVSVKNLVFDEPPADAFLAQPLHPIEAVAAEEPLRNKVDFVVRRNDTLESIFRHLKLRLEDLTSILSVSEVRRSLSRIRPGDTVTLVHDDGMVHELARRISDTEVLSIRRGDNGFAAEVIATPIDTLTSYASGTIDSSLFAAASEAGVRPETILRLANDIFGWEIDFALDIRHGDRFGLLYQQKYRGGEYLGDGRVLAAEFVNDGETHRAVYYASADGRIEGYFSPDGRSMRRQFLRAPLDFTRISSNFNRARRHPILNMLRRHQGVDYAASTGTIIKAAGDGRVDFIGMKGGYGKVIVLEHGGRISTLYAHMSRFASGLREGQRVKQGSTIGYVGRSGAATGPHLHYEYRVSGIHKNPRTVPLPEASPIPKEYLADFRSSSTALLAQLEQSRGTTVVALSAN